MMKVTVFVISTILVTVHQTLAQSQGGSIADGSQSSSNHQIPNFFGFPLPSQFPQPPFFREQREADGTAVRPDATAASTEEQEGRQDRFFFNLHSHSTYVSCNSTTQAGATCTSCNRALNCGSNDVGRLQHCHGFLPYCNVGRCSFFPGELCTNSTG